MLKTEELAELYKNAIYYGADDVHRQKRRRTVKPRDLKCINLSHIVVMIFNMQEQEAPRIRPHRVQ
jgi:hypothetical protein